MDDARTIARAGDLAMRFARETAKQVVGSRAGAAWEARTDAGLSRHAAMRRIRSMTPFTTVPAFPGRATALSGRDPGLYGLTSQSPPILFQPPSDRDTGDSARDPVALPSPEGERTMRKAAQVSRRPLRPATRMNLFHDVEARLHRVQDAIAERSVSDGAQSREVSAGTDLSAHNAPFDLVTKRQDQTQERIRTELRPERDETNWRITAADPVLAQSPRALAGSESVYGNAADPAVRRPVREKYSEMPQPAADAASMPLNKMNPLALRRNLLRTTGLGEMMAASLRARLQPHLRFDPAIARIHRGGAAAAAARELRAEAFTIGQDVFFGEGRYAPDTREGFGLLAHELAHVGQQAAQIGDRMRFFTATGGDEMEGEAQQVGAAAMRADDLERRNRTGGALHQASAAPNPALAFSLSSPRSRGGSPMPAQTATEESGSEGAKVEPAASDARAVTDRVYELMKQEIALGRERGLSKWKGR